MNLSKVIVFAIFAFGLGTASYAEECRGGALIDKYWENGAEDCISADREDNGWGNGDDEAPGGSLENNNAENHEGVVGSDGTDGGEVTNSSGNTPPGRNK